MLRFEKHNTGYNLDNIIQFLTDKYPSKMLSYRRNKKLEELV